MNDDLKKQQLRNHKLLATGLLFLFQFQLLAQGNLMIVGGGLESDNKEVFEENSKN